MKIPTDQEIQAFVRALMHKVYRERAEYDQTQTRLFMQLILRRIVGEQITAIEGLGGLGSWSRDSLSKLLADAAEIEAAQIFGAVSETYAIEMQKLTGHPTEEAEPASADPEPEPLKPSQGPCTNDPVAKAREVIDTFSKVCPPESPYAGPMRTLFMRGVFRHAEDVAFARIMLEHGEGLDEIEEEFQESYLNHRCDPVYPS